jgi:hypothetical protein
VDLGELGGESRDSRYVVKAISTPRSGFEMLSRGTPCRGEISHAANASKAARQAEANKFIVAREIWAIEGKS